MIRAQHAAQGECEEAGIKAGVRFVDVLGQAALVLVPRVLEDGSDDSIGLRLPPITISVETELVGEPNPSVECDMAHRHRVGEHMAR
jgi:hypothetical protein